MYNNFNQDEYDKWRQKHWTDNAEDIDIFEEQFEALEDDYETEYERFFVCDSLDNTLHDEIHERLNQIWSEYTRLLLLSGAEDEHHAHSIAADIFNDIEEDVLIKYGVDL